MKEPEVLERMRADWNRRAAEDANYYVAFGRREQDDAEFYATAADVLRNLEREMKRTDGRGAALEIGCGPGRLMRPLSRKFDEIHGVDVSDEMIRLARERLSDAPNAHVHVNSGSDLAMFPDDRFDFVYSYAVFQHIPSAAVVFGYLREARRVLKPGGVLRFQANGLPPSGECDTWSGVSIAPEDIVAFARDEGLRLLALEQAGTQYMWVTCRKPPRPSVRNISNAHTGEAATPASGALACISMWVRNLPAECDLIGLSVTADGRSCVPVYAGPPGRDGVSQVNARLPEGVRTGLLPVELLWNGELLCSGWARILPAPPLVPRLESLTDGVNLLSGPRIASRSVKAALSEVAEPGDFRAAVDGVEARAWDSFCTDAATRRYEYNFRLPDEIGPGPREVRISLGKRRFAPVAIEVA